MHHSRANRQEYNADKKACFDTYDKCNKCGKKLVQALGTFDHHTPERVLKHIGRGWEVRNKANHQILCRGKCNEIKTICDHIWMLELGCLDFRWIARARKKVKEGWTKFGPPEDQNYVQRPDLDNLDFSFVHSNGNSSG